MVESLRINTERYSLSANSKNDMKNLDECLIEAADRGRSEDTVKQMANKKTTEPDKFSLRV